MQFWTRIGTLLLALHFSTGCSPDRPVHNTTSRLEAPSAMRLLGMTKNERKTWRNARNQFKCKHGSYSKDYVSDWAALPTGKESDWKSPTATTPTHREVCYLPWKSKQFRVDGEGAPFYHLADLDLDVYWDASVDDKGTTLAYIRNFRRVLVENVNITQRGGVDDCSTKNPGDVYAAKDTLHISNCDTVIIRNSHFAGAADGSHIRIDGCKCVFIDNVEIEGLTYGNNTELSNGQGIYVYNCSNIRPSDNNPFDATPPLPGKIECSECCPNVREVCEGDAYSHKYRRLCLEPSDPDYVDYVTCGTNKFQLECLVIQNSYIHGYEVDDGGDGNQDAFHLVSPANGVLFNNVVETWDPAQSVGRADAAFDIDHARYCDTTYSDNYFRIERNMFLNNDAVKTPGLSDGTNQLLIVNNILLNTRFTDYHKKHDNYLIHDTFAYSGFHLATGETENFYRQNGPWNEGKTVMRNNLIYVAPDMAPDEDSADPTWKDYDLRKVYLNNARYYREICCDGDSCSDDPCKGSDNCPYSACTVTPAYSTSGRYGQLTKMVDPDFQLYVGIPLLWAHETTKTYEYDPSSECPKPKECNVEEATAASFEEWKRYVDPWIQSYRQFRDVNSHHYETEDCFSDPRFTNLTPLEFVPTACFDEAGFADPAALDIQPPAPFQITQGFFGGNRLNAPSLTVGAVQFVRLQPPPEP